MWCSMQCISCHLDNRRVEGHHRGCSQLRPPVRFTGCSQCLSPSRRWRWVSLLHTNTMTELWPWRCRSFTSSSSPGPRPQFGRIQSVSPPPCPTGETPSSSANCSGPMKDNNVCDNLILVLEQLVRKWEELGSGAGPEDGQLQQENMEKRQLLREINQLAREQKKQLRKEKDQLAWQKKCNSPGVSNSGWREDGAGGQEQPPDPGTQEVQRKNNNRNSNHTIIPPTIYNDYLIIKGWNGEIW